ncbi:MAG TPA: Stp1/IreP family PP2C-type Ser/Thr phosphatase [Gemmatimonadaceae bacterium]|nr:Stp1/IreP family PP2C-type Ser/Thr phosphatase [Gemmatimonadaceae bacterium]
MRVFAQSDVGQTREHNEDSFLVADLSADRASLAPEVQTHALGPHGTLFMVADGLGGAAAGEIASQMAVDTVLEELRKHWRDASRVSPDAFATALQAAAETANARIYAYALTHPEHRGLGTTATIAGALHDTLYIVQVGDSRAYLVRGGRIQQLTRDQSLMQQLIDAGEITPEEAEHSDRRNIILQALGPDPVVKIDLTFQPLRRGDTLVLCTDGLSGLVRAEEMAAVVAQEEELSAVCARLIAMANDRGGPDNITVVVARFGGGGLSDVAAGDRVGHAAYPPSRGGSGEWSVMQQPNGRQTTPWMAQPLIASDDAPPARRRNLDRGSRALFLAIIATAILLGLVLIVHEISHAGAANAGNTPAAADSAQAP